MLGVPWTAGLTNEFERAISRLGERTKVAAMRAVSSALQLPAYGGAAHGCCAQQKQA